MLNPLMHYSSSLCMIRFVLALLLTGPVVAPRGRKLKQLLKRRISKRGAGSNLSATHVLATAPPLHRVDCGGRVCRPGEGNLKGYLHWSMCAPLKRVHECRVHPSLGDWLSSLA